MPIIKHIPIYAAPKRMLAYVTNEEKTEDTLVTGLNCSTKYNDAYEDMKFNFEMYSGERFFKRSIKSDTAKRERQKIRLHHYIQSFKPGEVTPEEAHQIGVEWAEKVFGKKHMVLCATHTDRGHIHNHFAVCPYDMYGKHWYANKKSMRMCRAISDEIALAHGLEIIEHPKKSYCHKYGEYKARKEGRSWKQKLCDDIDNAIMKDNVRSIDDLLKELMKQGYGIKRGKYISIKVKQNRTLGFVSCSINTFISLFFSIKCSSILMPHYTVPYNVQAISVFLPVYPTLCFLFVLFQHRYHRQSRSEVGDFSDVCELVKDKSDVNGQSSVKMIDSPVIQSVK